MVSPIGVFTQKLRFGDKFRCRQVLENGKGLLIQKLDDNIVKLNQHSADIAALNATIAHLKKDH